MRSYTDQRRAGRYRADGVGRRFDARHRNCRQPLVERPVVPEVLFAAANAAVTGTNRVRHAVIPSNRRAGVVGTRTTAAHLVKAPALFRAVVVPSFDKLPGIEERTPVALVVNALSIEHFRPAHAIQFRQCAESQNVGEHAGHHLSDRRAAGHIDDRLDAKSTRGPASRPSDSACAACTHPFDAQEPHAITAFALSAVSSRMLRKSRHRSCSTRRHRRSERCPQRPARTGRHTPS